MQTYTEMQAEELAKKQRAMEYEALINRREGLRANIQRFAGAAVDLGPLAQIVQLVKDIPNNLVTRATVADGRPIVAGGLSVCDMLLHIAEGALADLQNREAKRVRNLDNAKAQFDQVEQALAKLEAAAA